MTRFDSLVRRVPLRWRLVVAVLAAGATLAVMWDPLRFFVQARPTAGPGQGYNLNAPEPPRGMSVQGFHHCTDGWCLAPGATGEITFEPRISPLARGLIVDTWLYRPPGTENRVEISATGGRTFVTLAENLHASGAQLGASLAVVNRASVILRVTASNHSSTEVLVLDQLIFHPLKGSPVPPFRPRNVLLAFAGLLLPFTIVTRRPGAAALTAVLVLAGAWLRLGFLVGALSAPLDPDAQGYLVYATKFSLTGPHHPYSAHFGEREPLYIGLAHFFLRLVGGGDYHLRLFTFLLSLTLIWASARFGRARFGLAGGTFIGALVAFNWPLSFESPRGLRLEAEVLLWLGFLWVAFLWRRPSGWVKALAIGLVGGALALLRTTYLPVVVALSAVAFVEHPRHGFRWLRYAALAALLAVGTIVPHRAAMYQIHGDPFWDTTNYARWNANMEFAGRPGFPSRAELEKNAYVGPRMTYREYMFGLHTVPELIEGTFRGYWKLFRGMRSDLIPTRERLPFLALNLTLQVLAAAGFVLALFSSRDRWLPLAFVLAEWAPSFLYDRALVEPYRHTYQGYPLFLMAAVLAVCVVARSVGLARLRAPRPEAGDNPAEKGLPGGSQGEPGEGKGGRWS